MIKATDCYGCPDRKAEPNCHTACEKYLAFLMAHERRKEDIRKQKAADLEQDQIVRTRVARVSGGRPRRKKE
jgi:predicted secreted Zn-dependent protease